MVVGSIPTWGCEIDLLRFANNYHYIILRTCMCVLRHSIVLSAFIVADSFLVANHLFSQSVN